MVARTPLEYPNKTGSDHAHFVVLAATACHPFFGLDRSRLLFLFYPLGKVLSIDTSENSQPAHTLAPFTFMAPRDTNVREDGGVFRPDETSDEHPTQGSPVDQARHHVGTLS